MWTDSTGKRSVSTASGHSEAAYAPTPPLPLLNWRHEVAHPLPPRPLRPRPERGLRLGGCRDGACRPSPYPPGTGRNPHQRLQNGPHPPTSGDWAACSQSRLVTATHPHPPGTGARVSSSQSSGLNFPPAPTGRRHSWCPGRSSQRLLLRPQGEKAGSDASERDGNTSPPQGEKSS